MPNSSRRIIHAAMGLALAAFSSAALAIPTLTADATTRGFALSTFLDRVPTNGVGPLGIANVPGGLLVTSYTDGATRIFSDVDGHHWGDSSNSTSAYGFGNAVDLVQLGSRYFMTQQSNGRVVEVTNTGAFVANIGSPISSATGITGIGNSLFVSDCCTGSNIWKIDVTTGTTTLFKDFAGGTPDGMSISLDGSVLYVSLDSSNSVKGYKISDGTEVLSVGVGGGPDGMETGTGVLAGKLYVNTNDGRLVEIDIATGTTTEIMTGGSRGDFVHADSANGTLLFTQSDSVLRLTAPVGGCIGRQCGNIPEPNALALLGLGLVAFGFVRRKVDC